jgi:CubicO group peptidase (beta-lactamase class C family)
VDGRARPAEEVTEVVDMRFDARRLLLCLGILLLSSGAAFSEDKAAAVESLLKRHQDVGAFNGTALVAENGKVIFKKGYGLADFEWKIPNTPDTKFRLGSITKQFTATLILQLVDEGKLTLDTTLAKALPYYRQDTGARVTIHHLLSHTSGIPSYTSQPGFFRDVSRDPYEVKDFALKFCSGELEFEPGSTFRYDNSGYFLLGAIIEQLTGKTYAEVLKERILDPLGMRATGYDLQAPLLEKRNERLERPIRGARVLPLLVPERISDEGIVRAVEEGRPVDQEEALTRAVVFRRDHDPECTRGPRRAPST